MYCELYAGEYKPKIDYHLPIVEADKLWKFPESAKVWRCLQRLNVTIQKGFDAAEVSEEVIEVLKSPECQPFIRKLESRGYMYEILDIVTCIMRFSSGRRTPVDSRESLPPNVDMHLDEMNMCREGHNTVSFMYREMLLSRLCSFIE